MANLWKFMKLSTIIPIAKMITITDIITITITITITVTITITTSIIRAITIIHNKQKQHLEAGDQAPPARKTAIGAM